MPFLSLAFLEPHDSSWSRGNNLLLKNSQIYFLVLLWQGI